MKKISKKISKLMLSITAIAMMFSMPVLAYESDFADGVYRYVNTGYTTSPSENDELVCKIKMYYYENNSDVMYCAVDDYFYKRNSAGEVIDDNSYGYAVARFEKGSRVSASSGRLYDYGNEPAWSGGCANWRYTPHYYGTTLY